MKEACNADAFPFQSSSHGRLQSTEVSFDSSLSLDTVRQSRSRVGLLRHVWAGPGVCEHQLSGQAIYRFSLRCLVSPRHILCYAKSLQSCLTLCDPINGSLPGSSAHGIFQARVLEWGAIAFSDSFIEYHNIKGIIISTFNSRNLYFFQFFYYK